VSDLSTRHCTACEGGVPRLTRSEVEGLLAQVPGWVLVEGGVGIERTFVFAGFAEAMAFVNRVAWIAHREDHHPDITVRGGRCVVRWSTFAVDGLTVNDFICAAKVGGVG
jgi:4a-hydroxytetrahydrobiopterin dehydratase